MQRFSVILFALVTLFAIVVPSSAGSLSHVNRNTNAERFARGLPPLPPTRRSTAKRHQHSQGSVPRSGRIQVRDHHGNGNGKANGNAYGHIQNGPAGPHGVNHGGDPNYSDLNVIFNPVQKSLFCLSPRFSGNGFYLGAQVSSNILGDDSTDYVVLTSVELGISTAEAGIWTIDPESGKFSVVWVNVNGSIVTLSIVYHEVENKIYFVGDCDGFISKNQGWKQVDFVFVD